MLGSVAFADAPGDVRIPTAGRSGIDGHGHLPRPRTSVLGTKRTVISGLEGWDRFEWGFGTPRSPKVETI